MKATHNYNNISNFKLEEENKFSIFISGKNKKIERTSGNNIFFSFWTTNETKRKNKRESFFFSFHALRNRLLIIIMFSSSSFLLLVSIEKEYIYLSHINKIRNKYISILQQQQKYKAEFNILLLF